MINDNLPMSPTTGSLINVYDQNFNGLGTTIELFNKQFEDERITRSRGKEVLNFSALSTSNIYQYLQTENIIEFGGRWFRIKYAEDDSSTKGLTHYDCYALWYELAEGTPTPLNAVGSTIGDVANSIIAPFGKWVELVIPDYLKNRSVNSITLQENSALYKLRYLAKRFNLELTFGYKEVIENELRYVKTVVFLQQYTESKIEFPLVVEENLKHIARTEDSRNLVTAYKISGKSENDEEEFTFAEINRGNDYLVDTSWFTSRGMRPRIIPKAKKDDRFTIKQNMLDAARSYLDIYAKPLVSYEASAILYEEIPNLHQSQLVIDDTYSIVEWRKVSSRKLNYDDLTASVIVFDDPRQDLMDLLNDDGDGALSLTEESDSRTIIRYANDAMGNGFNDESGDYIGVLVTKRKASELGPQDFSWHKIKGDPGPQGAPGRDGVDGIAGKDGVGIIETQVSYYLSTSGTTKPQTGWTENVPPLVKGRYLWTRTVWRYSDGQLETGYSVAYVGQDGNTGRDGLPGKDGVGITSTIISYARSPSGTSAPTSGWSTSVPTVPQGMFLWTKTVWSYTDNTSETGYSVAKMGEKGDQGLPGPKGADGKSSYTHIAYANMTQLATENSSFTLSLRSTVRYGKGDNWFYKTFDAGTYTVNNATFGGDPYPTVTKVAELVDDFSNSNSDGKAYMGVYVDFNSADSTNPADYNWTLIKGSDGIAGKDGVGIASTVITYGLSTSDSVQPATWSVTVPPLTKGQYLWTKNVWTYTDGKTETGYTKTYIPKDGNNGNDGIAGKDGVGIVSTTIAYGRSTSGTSNAGITWTSSVPTVPDGEFLWTKTIWDYSDNTTETGYSVARMGADGTGHLTTWTFYKLSNSTSAPQVVPIGESTNLGHLGPNNTWTPFKELNRTTEGWHVIDFDKIAKSDIIPDEPFTWDLEASFNGVSNFNGSTSFNIKFENWYTNSAGSNVYNPLGTRDHTASNFSATNNTAVINYFRESITWTVPRVVYDAIPEGGFLNLRIRIDRFTKLYYHVKNSYVTYGTVPSDPAKRGLGNYSTYGWKASPEAVTQALPYLWIYQVQLYDNGRELAIPPAIIGSQGDPGPAGVGISNVKPYFILSNTPTGVVRTSGTWSTTPLTPTLSQKYVWTYLETTLSNGTKQYSEPYITGVYGDKGDKGDQGTPGPPGKDGRTSYIHWAYSDNADGTGLTTSDNGQRYIGQYSDYTQADSTDKTKYRWADRWAKIEVGGGNLIKNGGFPTNTRYWSGNMIVSQHGFYYSGQRKLFLLQTAGTAEILASTNRFEVKRNTDYTLSFYAFASGNVKHSDVYFLGRKSNETNDFTYANAIILNRRFSNLKAEYVTVTFNSGDNDNGYIRFDNNGSTDGFNAVLFFGEVMLAEGSAPQKWSASYDEIAASIDSKADQALTQQQLNMLIEKAQLMQTELEAKVAMETLSDFERAYKAYVEANNKAVAKSEADLIAAGRRVDAIVETLGGLSKTKTFIDTYIKEANEGIIIGTNDNVSQIRVTHDRIAMYSAGKEVMYISQGVIHIDNGVFTKSLQIGRFVTSQHESNPDINICRYVG